MSHLTGLLPGDHFSLIWQQRGHGNSAGGFWLLLVFHFTVKSAHIFYFLLQLHCSLTVFLSMGHFGCC